MYNHYLASASNCDDPLPIHNMQPNESGANHTQTYPNSASIFSDLARGLSGQLQNVKLDMNTVIALAVVWFLLKDGEEVDWDQLILIGVLLILGI